LSAIAFSDWKPAALLRIPDSENDTDRDVLRVSAGILRCLVWWPFQKTLSGCTIYAGWGFETFPVKSGCSIAVSALPCVPIAPFRPPAVFDGCPGSVAGLQDALKTLAAASAAAMKQLLQWQA
jgi:hypothetical protein